MRAWLVRAAALATYSTLLRMATPVYLARLWWRGAKEPLYRMAWHERLGGWHGLQRPGRVWIHAVSLGETRAAASLIDALRALRPGVHVLLTHGTATGRAAGAALLRSGDAQAWLPWDTPGAVRRFLAQHRPVLGVLMETEVWPNLLLQAQASGLPMVLANARLSARSAARGARLGALLRPAARAFTQVLAQTQDDAERLRAAGAGNVVVMGNVKFDMAPSPQLLAMGRAWRAALHAAPAHHGVETLAPRAVVLAAVTREGEEGPLMAAWRAVPLPRPLLVLVPRHPQRFDAVAAVVLDAGFTLARRSAWLADATAGPAAPPAEAVSADVWLGDSLGEMPAYYALADVALLGGSFAPLGGQNLIEAAACGCPLIMGSSTFNFAQAAELSLAAGAAVRATDINDAVLRAVALARDPQRLLWAQRALAFAARHRGAAARMAQALDALLPR